MQKNVFISYRRSDSSYAAQMVQMELARQFGEARIFHDKGIAPGANFEEELLETLGGCDVLIAMIGPDWLSEENRARLHDEKDWVRIELTTAIDRAIKVIPVILRGAEVPQSEDLPVELALLPKLQAIKFQEDLDHSLAQLVKAIGEDLKPIPLAEQTRDMKIGELVRRARLVMAEADQMYLQQISQPASTDFGTDDRATVDLADMLQGFDGEAHHAKLEEAHQFLQEARQLDETHIEVLLALAELLIELTPDDPTDEQDLLYKVQSLVSAPRDETERYLLAKATFLLATSGDRFHEESLRDARALFEKLGRREWVRQCDDLLALASTSAPAQSNHSEAIDIFQPAGHWQITDAAFPPNNWQLQLFPNGEFQGYQHSPGMGVEGSVQGQWGFNPAQKMLAIQGVLAGMYPFGTTMFLHGRTPAGWTLMGADGMIYQFTPLAS